MQPRFNDGLPSVRLILLLFFSSCFLLLLAACDESSGGRGGPVQYSGDSRRLSDDARAPLPNIDLYVLFPRNTLVRPNMLALQWTPAPDAVLYKWEVSGPRVVMPALTISPEEAACVLSDTDEPRPICHYAWPDEWQITPGVEYFLSVDAYTNTVSTPAQRDLGMSFALLSEEESSAVGLREAAIMMSLTTTETRQLWLGDLYTSYGLYGDALQAYQVALEAEPSPALYNTIGDLYVLMDAFRYAVVAYEDALALLPADDQGIERARAEYGLGYIYAYWRDWETAIPHLEIAEPSFDISGDAKSAAAVEALLIEVNERLSSQ